MTATQGHLPVLRYLIDRGADKTATRRDGYTILHLAAVSGNTEMVKYIVEELGLDILTRGGPEG